MVSAGQQDAMFREQARRTEGIDTEVYARYNKDPLTPIIGRGDADLRVGLFGRDPGHNEIRHGTPFIGAGGQKLRQALYQHLHAQPMPDFAASLAVGRHFFWANTVPYKPVGNKAWSMAVKKRFQPLMMAVLAEQWHGDALITLGREAFLWFGIGQSRDQRQRLEAFWRSDARFEAGYPLTLGAPTGRARRVTLYPLPHPSPLNATWYKHFPAMLRARLQQLHVRLDNLRVAE